MVAEAKLLYQKALCDIINAMAGALAIRVRVKLGLLTLDLRQPCRLC
jgi:hypothetical protein